jgi:hypothetical protein
MIQEMIGMGCGGFNRKQVTVGKPGKVGIAVMILIFIFKFVHLL